MKNFNSYLERLNKDNNFTYETKSVSFENKNRKRFVLLIDDLHRCLEAIWKHGNEIDKEFEGDWTYDESKYRKTFGRFLDPLQPNTVATSLGSQTPNTVRLLELYAGFLLGLDASESLSIPEYLKPTKLHQLFAEMPQRERFENWLSVTRGLSIKSVGHYSNAVANKLSKIAEVDLYTLSSIEELTELKPKIESDTEYVRANAEGNQMYSAALNRYIEFLKNSHTNITSKPFKQIPSQLSRFSICESILSKPFAILTGASGTGKTKLAETLAKILSNEDNSNSVVVAVGADWTDNRNVLGFVNYLNTDEAGPSYQSTPILDLLLRAKDDSDVPYFLILDEMNLSHVERYFADFLSVMEQPDGTLKLHSENGNLKRAGKDTADVPAELPYPENLFVIGTVNIDETTYMFSPKVLDRANVIEFTVSEKEIGDFLEDPKLYKDIEPAEPGIAEGFLALAKEARAMNLDTLPQAPKEAIAVHLLDLFKILKAGRFEFAYRSAKEINIYLQACRYFSADKGAWDTEGWKSDLDDQVLQKLLPKLHGSMGRIGKLLANLADYCQSGAYQEAQEARLDAVAALDGSSARFPKSLAKLQSMAQTLRDEQFVSFIQ